MTRKRKNKKRKGGKRPTTDRPAGARDATRDDAPAPRATEAKSAATTKSPMGSPARSPTNRLVARSLAIVVAVHLALLCLTLAVASAFRPDPILTGLDQLAKPGTTQILRARLDREGPSLPFARFHPEGAVVEFFELGERSAFPVLGEGEGRDSDLVSLETLGPGTRRATAVVDASGVATASIVAPSEPGSYVYRVRAFTGIEEENPRAIAADTFLVLAVTADDTGILISDIDNTLGVSRSRPEDVAPLADAQRVLSEQARTRRVVYLTDRPTILSTRTRNWLAENGFPIGPIFFRTPSSGYFAATRHRDDVLRDIHARWKNVPWGIVAAEHNAHLCVENDVDAIVLSPYADSSESAAPGGRETAKGIRRASSWAAIETLLQKS